MRVNIYIKDADKSIWDQIENKSQWISDKLNVKGVYTHTDKPKTIHTSRVHTTEPSIRFCKHSAAVGLCKHGCIK